MGVDMTPASIAIEPLRAQDRARWGELWLQYQQFYGVDIPAADTQSTWDRIQTGRVHAFGAFRGAEAQLVGIVHFLYHEDTWSTAPACYLQDLYVDPRARGGGCARRLIEAVARAARTAGANSPYWLTHESNAVARRLYDRLGKNHGFIQYAYVG
jgi:GNAT superfamily N-acetyltransferase